MHIEKGESIAFSRQKGVFNANILAERIVGIFRQFANPFRLVREDDCDNNAIVMRTAISRPKLTVTMRTPSRFLCNAKETADFDSTEKLVKLNRISRMFVLGRFRKGWTHSTYHILIKFIGVDVLYAVDNLELEASLGVLDKGVFLQVLEFEHCFLQRRS